MLLLSLIFIIPAFLFTEASYNLSLVLILIPCLLISGYFWDLVENIINADIDISANNIYNGKIIQNLKIELPEFKIFKLIWRGIASVFASFLIGIPYFILIYIFVSSGNIQFLPPWFILFFTLFYISFFPALFWNYGKNNSVTAVFDIRKAVYISGNYPLRYCSHILGLILVYVISSIAEFALYQVLSYASIPIIWIISVYLLYVNAYILGTLAAKNEF